MAVTPEIAEKLIGQKVHLTYSDLNDWHHFKVLDVEAENISLEYLRHQDQEYKVGQTVRVNLKYVEKLLPLS